MWGGTYAVADELEARSGEELDELRVALLVGVPRPARHLRQRLEVEEDEYLARRVLCTQCQSSPGSAANENGTGGRGAPGRSR